jgi:hypothetical protein
VKHLVLKKCSFQTAIKLLELKAARSESLHNQAQYKRLVQHIRAAVASGEESLTLKYTGLTKLEVEVRDKGWYSGAMSAVLQSINPASGCGSDIEEWEPDEVLDNATTDAKILGSCANKRDHFFVVLACIDELPGFRESGQDELYNTLGDTEATTAAAELHGPRCDASLNIAIMGGFRAGSGSVSQQRRAANLRDSACLWEDRAKQTRSRFNLTKYAVALGNSNMSDLQTLQAAETLLLEAQGLEHGPLASGTEKTACSSPVLICNIAVVRILKSWVSAPTDGEFDDVAMANQEQFGELILDLLGAADDSSPFAVELLTSIGDLITGYKCQNKILKCPIEQYLLGEVPSAEHPGYLYGMADLGEWLGQCSTFPADCCGCWFCVQH